ncbi:ribosome small subunit-dependent GTPase A [Lachnospiraceae bacterium MD329]|jgi:ribosome biogenesis GTPase|nr:ribosome small subunit-dependent GTPase A [Lachnospiraceae bacterium MD329]
MKGTIIKGIGGFYYVKASDNVYECKARGVFRKKRITPTIGDVVEIETSGEKGSIVDILDRRSYLVRPPVANIDTMLLVVAAAAPEPSLFLIDKMLVNAEINNIHPVLCINKTDLEKRNDIKKLYENAGYEVFCVSAEKNKGTDKLKKYLSGRTTAFAGLSGVGKSSLLSIITEDTLETGDVSEKIQRGRHTTRHVELFELNNGGFVLDTPGFSSLELEGIKADELWEYFPEMRNHRDECRFRGCSHINEPDCVIKNKVESGEIASTRYGSYTQLYKQLKSVKEWEKK